MALVDYGCCTLDTKGLDCCVEMGLTHQQETSVCLTTELIPLSN
jgi:hypothetical protein